MDSLVEEKIRQAVEDGELDNLPGKGKPMVQDDLSGVPGELRIGYKMLKNAGMIPEEVQLKKEMVTLEELIAQCVNEEERASLRRELNQKTLRFNQMIEKRKMKRTSAFRKYKRKIYGKVR
ncbi:MAG TPA: DnaJ family domain-containing protein [Bacillales bacterium]